MYKLRHIVDKMRKKTFCFVILNKSHNISNYQLLNRAQKPFQNKIVRDDLSKLCFSSCEKYHYVIYIGCMGKVFKK